MFDLILSYVKTEEILSKDFFFDCLDGLVFFDVVIKEQRYIRIKYNFLDVSAVN
jgi:hypothetical protein